MKKDTYKRTFAKVKMPDYLEKEILNMTVHSEKSQRKPFYLRPIAACLILPVLVACMFSILVYAGVIDLSNIYQLIFGDNTGYIEQYISPIETEQSLSETSDGIQIKLLSAISDEKSLRIFATATDLTDNRLSSETKFDNWGLDQGHGGNISVVDYNKDTKTAVLLITSLGDNQQGKANLRINGFTTGGQFIENKDETKINLYDLTKQQASSILSQDEIFVGGGSHQGNKGDERLFKTTRLLAFGNMSVNFDNIDWITISNVGFVDGHLHIQTKTQFDQTNDLANIKLADGGNILYGADMTIYYAESNRRQGDDLSLYSIYKTFIYKDITTPEQLKALSVSIDYMLEGQANESNWQLSFEILEKASMNIAVMKNLNINGKNVMVDTVSLSPLGVSLKLPTSHLTNYKRTDQASIVYQDDTVILLENTTTTGYEGETVLTFEGKIIELEKVKSIILNGDVIPVMTDRLSSFFTPPCMTSVTGPA